MCIHVFIYGVCVCVVHVYVSVYECLYGMCACSCMCISMYRWCGVCVHACARMYAHRPEVGTMWGFFSVSFRLIFLKKYLTLNLELSDSVRLAT